MPAPDSDVGTCKVCRRPIRFVHLVNGRRVPVELDQDPAGRLATSTDVDGVTQVLGEFLERVNAYDVAGRQVWRPHSDVCRQRKGRHAPPADLLAQIKADIRAARERQEEAATWAALG